MSLDSQEVFKRFKYNRTSYDEEKHCKLLIETMSNKYKATVSSFCIAATISENVFQYWVKKYELFSEIYSFCKMYAREMWEEDGREIRDMTLPIGTISYAFEYWKLIGWSRFGVSKNSRIKLDLNPDDSPNKHYAQLLEQASKGDFTAGEIKQLMEAVNVGLNTHQVFELQKEIDQLKSDLATMQANTDAHNSVTNK